MIKSIRYFLLIQCMVWVGMVMAAHKHNPKGTAAWCGSEVPSMTWESQLQRIIQHQKSLPGNKQQSATYNIPVVVHVVYYNSAQNISAAQVQSQITVLNNDFAGTGLNSNSIPAPFAPLLANTNITFCLAKLSPANTILPEPGIDRIDARAKGWPNPGVTGWTTNFIDNTIKKTTIWDPNFYLNIWVVPAIRSTNGGITLGYATFPSLTGLDGLPTDPGNDLNDGFVCRADFFGTTGSASASKGRTSTHEIGHWLGLRHIWGDDSCGTDFVDDTPTALKENYNCPVFPHRTCENTSSGDMFMNFMDYTDDDCMALFTLDQKQRMNTTLQFGDFRKNLINSPVCDTTKQIPFARFDYELSPFSTCATSKSYNFTDRSTFAPKSWSWTFEGGNPASSNLQNPTGIVFNTPGLHNVTLVVTNAVGTHTITKTINVSLVGSTVAPLLEDFESPVFPPVGWILINRNGNPLINWEVIEGYSAYGIGNKSLKFNNTEYDAKGKRDDIVSPKINFTGITSAYIKFDVAYTPYFGPIVAGGPNENIFDTLEVHITDNCLNTTQLVYRKGGNSLATFLPGLGDEFYPAPNQWRRDSIALPAAYLNKENIQIVFRNLGNYGHSIYVDNINISPVVSLPTATASFTVSDTVVCPAGTLRFTNTSTATVGSPDSIRWTFQGGSLATATTSPVDVVFNTPGTYTISLIAYKSGLPSAAATKTIRVKSNPTVTVTSPTICSGGTATLTAGGADSYTWTGGLSAVSNPTTPVLNSNATYTVTGTTNGCSATALSTVTVKAKPNVTITPDQQVCSGDSVVLTASGATSYQWNAGNPNNTASITVFPTGVSTYTVIGTTNGCTDTASTNITIKSKPTVTVTSSPICAGNTATLQASGATTYTWTGGLSAVSNPTTPILNSNATYTVTGTTNGCSGTAVATVTVNAKPTVTVNSPTICAGNTASLTASGANTYTWSPNIGTGATVTTPVLNSNATYTVTGTNTTTTCSNTAVATVTVTNTAPIINVTPSSSSVCEGTAVTLTASGADTYTWSQAGTTTANSLTFTPTGDVTVTVTGSLTGCGLTGNGSASITVKTKPTVSVDKATASICSGETITLTASGADSYSWSPNIGTGATVTSGALTANTTYTVTGTTNGCSNTATSVVTVKTLPNTTLSASDNSICSGESVTLTAGGADSYSWTPSGAGSSQVVSPTSNVTYTVTGTTNGCSKAASQSITVSTTPATPAITQSNDTLYSSVVSAGAQYKWYKGSVLVATTSTAYYKLTSAGSYTLVITNGECTSGESAAIAAVYTGIKNKTNAIEELQVFPNPTDGQIRLTLNLNKLGKVAIGVFTTEGRELQTTVYGTMRQLQAEIDMSGYASGLYLLKITIDDEVHYHKVSKH